jgi:putative ABC transport system permease protein
MRTLEGQADDPSNPLNMLISYFKIFLRLLRKDSTYYAINVGGLAIGIASFLIIAIYCSFELSYDSFHRNGENIVRIVGKSARTPNPLGMALIEETSGIETATRVIYSHSGLVLLDSAGNAYDEKGFSVDSTFFDVFSFPFLHGSKSALHNYRSLVVSRRFAEKVFGKTDVLGKFLKIQGMPGNEGDFRIGGVIETPPMNSQFDFDILTRYNPHWNRENWQNNLVYTYAVLKEGFSKDLALRNIRTLFRHKTNALDSETEHIELQTLRDQHFDVTRTFDFGPHIKLQNIHILSTIAALILFIACINFINISTAKATDRKKEVAMKKINGATRKQLISQFLSESLFISIVGFVFACGIFFMVAPTAQALTGVEVVAAIGLIASWKIILFLLIPFVVGIVAGLYPAIIISSFGSINEIKDNRKPLFTNLFRKTLLAIQFGITCFLFIGTLTIMEQFRFMNSKDLGFTDDQIVVLNVGFPGLRNRIDPIRNDLLKNPRIVNVSAALTVPGDLTYTMPYSIYDSLSNDDHRLSWAGLYVDPAFIDNLNMKIIDGRAFSSSNPADTLNFVLNETAVAFLVNKYGEEWKAPVGRELNYFRSNDTGYFLAKKGLVIGVVKDFNYYSLHQKIDPLVIQVDYRLLFQLLVKVQPDNVSETLAYIERSLNQNQVTRPFNYVFLDEHFGRAYEKEKKFKEIFMAFSILSILISACGLYGLVLYAAEKRSKEMSIRKVLGARTGSILRLFTKEFFTPIGFAFVFAGPLAWWMMMKWLEQFAYRIDIQADVFFGAAVLCFSIVLITILFRTLVVARANPCKALREN